MGLRIRTNISSVNAQRRLARSTNEVKESSAKLASGLRINKAADDAAGLAISENLRADIRSLGQAKRNANDGVSLVQTAEGGLMETSNMLIRLRELAIQAASDTIGNSEREFTDREFVSLKQEIDRIASSTEFNGTRLLIGEADVHEDIANDATYPLEIQVGAQYFENADNVDADNPINVIKLDFSKINAFAGNGEGSLGLGTAEEGSRVNSKEAAQSSIAKLDSAITKINDYRSYLGAVQNRLGSTIRNLEIQNENMTEARSRISDTDYAYETAKMTQANILQQAGTSILGQANQQPSIALKLLG